MNFEFADQNDISKKHKIIWVYSALMSELFDQAFDYDCNIEFDQVQFYFKIQGQHQEKLLQMRQFLNTIQIIVYKANSQIKAQSILKLINSDQLNQKLKTYLNCKIAKLMNFSKIDLDCFMEQSHNLVIELADQWKSDQLILVYNDKENKGNEYYKQKFEEFIYQNIKSGQDTLKIVRDKYIENQNLIISFTKEQTEIEIEIEEGNQNCILIFTFWYYDNMDQEKQIVNKYKDYILKNILQKDQKQKSIIMAPKQQNSLINQCSFEYQFQEFPQEAFIYLNKYYNDKEQIDMVIMNNQKSAKFYFKGSNSEKEKLKEMVQKELNSLQSFDLQIVTQLQIDVAGLRKQIEYVLNKRVTQPKCAILFEKQIAKELRFKIFCSESPFQFKEEIKLYFDSLMIKKFPQTDLALFQAYKVENAQQFCEKTLVCYNGYLFGNALKINEILSNIPVINSDVLQVKNQVVEFIDKPIQQNINYFHNSEFQGQSNQQSELKSSQKSSLQDKYSIQSQSQLENQNLQEIIEPNQNIKKKCFKITVSKNEEKFLYVKDSDLCSENCQLTVIFCKSFSNLVDFKDINETCVQFIKKCGIDYEKSQQQQFNQSPYILTKIQDKFILALQNMDLYETDDKKCFDQIKANIETIFQIAFQNKVKSFALPIFGCGPCDYSFHKAAKKIFNLLLLNLKYKNIEKIVLVEDYKERFDLLKKLVQTNVLQPEYQLSFSVNGNQFSDEINIIINDAIKAHKNRVQIYLSYFQKIPTHIVDFQTLEIIEIKTNKSFKLSSKNQNNYLQYYINNEQSEQRFNSFLNLLNRFHMTTCKFYQNDIFFIIDFGYYLEIDNKRIEVQNKMHVDIESEIFQCKEEQIELKSNISQNEQKVIKQQVNKNNNNNNNNFEKLKVELPKNFTQKFIKDIWRNFKKTGNYKVVDQLTDIQFLTDLLVSKETDWSKVENTVDLESLSPNDKNYEQIIRVLKDFYVIDVKQIKNQQLLEKYEIAQKQLVKSHQANALGILKNHPKVSYDKNSLGIEVYDGDFGKGAYFTENFTNINYKKNVGDNDQTFAALYCSVGTGKSFILEPNRELYRSLDGYDSNCSPDQNIFILYDDCIARAYPSYEVTFRKKANLA